MDVTTFLQYVVNGVAFGSILALGGIGLSLVYGILNLSNFAQGDLIVMGAFATLLFTRELYSDLPIAAIVLGALFVLVVVGDRVWKRALDRMERNTLAIYGGVLVAFGAILLATGARSAAVHTSTTMVLLAAGLVGAACVAVVLLASEALVWRPLRRKRATGITLVIVSIGVSLVVRSALQLRFGGELLSFERPGIPAHDLWGLRISDAQLVAVGVSLGLIALVHLFLKHTRAGKAMRALADNADLARVSGIDVDRMVVYVWILTALLVTAAGILLTLVSNNAINVNAGAGILLALFASVILGGLGSAYGAAAGGFVVGVAMKTSALWIGTEYEIASAFIILILVLLVRPQGILGGRI